VQQRRNLDDDDEDDEDDLARNISSKGVPAQSKSSLSKDQAKTFQQKHNPLLFNFDHYYDPELTPRKGWQ